MTRVRVERSSTGVPGLDDVLHGGFIAGRFYLVDGNPGAGKTTLALQFLLEGMRAASACLYITLSETKEELRAVPNRTAGRSTASRSRAHAEDRDLDRRRRELTMYAPVGSGAHRDDQPVLDAVERLNADAGGVRLAFPSCACWHRARFAIGGRFSPSSNSSRAQCTVLMLDDPLPRVPTCSCIASRTAWFRWTAGSRYGADATLAGREVAWNRFSRRLPRLRHRQRRSRGFSPPGRRRAQPDLPRASPSGVAALDALLGGGPDRGTARS